MGGGDGRREEEIVIVSRRRRLLWGWGVVCDGEEGKSSIIS